MPFFDDTGVGDDALRSPVWGAFGLLFEHLEQLVALNVGWALQIVPLLAALVFHAWPAWLWDLLMLYSIVALVVATGMLYRLVALVSGGDALHAGQSLHGQVHRDAAHEPGARRPHAARRRLLGAGRRARRD